MSRDGAARDKQPRCAMSLPLRWNASALRWNASALRWNASALRWDVSALRWDVDVLGGLSEAMSVVRLLLAQKQQR